MGKIVQQHKKFSVQIREAFMQNEPNEFSYTVFNYTWRERWKEMEKNVFVSWLNYELRTEVEMMEKGSERMMYVSVLSSVCCWNLFSATSWEVTHIYSTVNIYLFTIWTHIMHMEELINSLFVQPMNASFIYLSCLPTQSKSLSICLQLSLCLVLFDNQRACVCRRRT